MSNGHALSITTAQDPDIPTPSMARKGIQYTPHAAELIKIKRLKVLTEYCRVNI